MKRSIANIFGTLGYMSLIVQWLWAGLTLGFPLFASKEFQTIFLPEPTTPVEPTVSSVSIPEPIAIILMVLASLFAIAISIYMVLAVPRTIGKVGKKVTVKSAETIAPYVTHHKRISDKRKKTLLERITWSVKAALLALPVLALLIPVSSDLGLTNEVVIGVGLTCAGFTLTWFGLQFLVVKLGALDQNDIL